MTRVSVVQTPLPQEEKLFMIYYKQKNYFQRKIKQGAGHPKAFEHVAGFVGGSCGPTSLISMGADEGGYASGIALWPVSDSRRGINRVVCGARCSAFTGCARKGDVVLKLRSLLSMGVFGILVA